VAQPDIMMMPALATYFGVTIDELFGYKLDVMTNKERLIRYMDKNGILVRGDVTLRHGGQPTISIRKISPQTPNYQESERYLRTVSRKTIWGLTCWWDWRTTESLLP